MAAISQPASGAVRRFRKVFGKMIPSYDLPRGRDGRDTQPGTVGNVAQPS
jgi:hypothetical protein